MVDKVGVGCEHPVREPVIAHELPDVLGGVELRAFGREHHQRDVVWKHEAGREVPSGLVDDEYGVLVGSHFGGDFGEVQVHRLGVAGGQDERGSLAIAGADSSMGMKRSSFGRCLPIPWLPKLMPWRSPSGYATL